MSLWVEFGLSEIISNENCNNLRLFVKCTARVARCWPICFLLQVVLACSSMQQQLLGWLKVLIGYCINFSVLYAGLKQKLAHLLEFDYVNLPPRHPKAHLAQYPACPQPWPHHVCCVLFYLQTFHCFWHQRWH